MKYFFIIICIICHFQFFSQDLDTSRQLQTFEKTISKFIINDDFLKSDKNLDLISERSSESISTILEEETTNYLKYYSPGNLSSISTRGGNASQTSLVYNDFVLNNPLNGIVDFSSIPSVFFNSVNVMYGLPSSNWGNGGLAGAIILNNHPTENKSLEFGSVFGSFKQSTNFLKLNYSKKKVSSSLKLFRQSAENNFKFLDVNNEIVNQENSAFYHSALMSDSKIDFSNSSLKIVLFSQMLERQVPKGMLESYTNAFQTDLNHRFFINYKYDLENSFIEFKTAYYDEQNSFVDSIRNIFSENPCKTLINQINFSKNINQFNFLKLNLTNSLAKSNSNNYDDEVQINRFSLNGIYKINNPKNKWKHLFNSRIVLDKKNLSPLTFSYSLNRVLAKDFKIYINMGKVYRFPTINDLYWSPGGNENLNPENGYSTDLGLLWTKDLSNTQLYFEPTIYSRWIDDWIIWQPTGTYWSPMNVKKVWNRGIETNSSISFKKREISFNFSLKTAYNLSTNIDIYNINDASLGKQLIYVPHYKFIFKSQIAYRNIRITYIHNYTGYRYTSRDNLYYLPAFNLGRLFLSWDLKFKKYPTKIFYKINNLYNTNYQLVINRPMPLINNEIGINFKINK
tara:strand:- start:14846 stop:16720 length:1875 start_codon:yes stop_codon:yes gene_type:complete